MSVIKRRRQADAAVISLARNHGAVVSTTEQRTSPRRKVALALQGGGSHGAFTWGVLDRILEDPTIDIVGVTGTSAGAMNAAVLVGGLLRGGPQQARTNLRRYWEAVGAMPGFGSLCSPMSGAAAAVTPLESIPAYVEMMKKNISPHDSPSSVDPLRTVLTEIIDFDQLRSQEEIQLVVCATNARTAQRRSFTNQDISVDALFASTCLPQLFRTVEIDGEPYWDGGWTGNPALAPLLRKTPACDLIMVRIDPISRPDAPRSLHDIFDRLTEIGFNSTFWLELGVLAALLRLAERGLLDRTRLGGLRFHDIQPGGIMDKFPMSTKRNNYPPLLEYLFDLGRQSGDAWIAEHGDALGLRSTIDLEHILPNEHIWGDLLIPIAKA
jgi:NTE family protein